MTRILGAPLLAALLILTGAARAAEPDTTATVLDEIVVVGLPWRSRSPIASVSPNGR